MMIFSLKMVISSIIKEPTSRILLFVTIAGLGVEGSESLDPTNRTAFSSIPWPGMSRARGFGFNDGFKNSVDGPKRSSRRSKSS